MTHRKQQKLKNGDKHFCSISPMWTAAAGHLSKSVKLNQVACRPYTFDTITISISQTLRGRRIARTSLNCWVIYLT